MKYAYFLSLVSFAVVAATASLWRSSGPLQAGADLQTDLSRGAEIYAEACASCHGANLEGEPNWRVPGPDGLLPAPPHDASGHTWHHPDQLLLEITMYGTSAVVGGDYLSNMPGFADTYSEAELREVLEWIKSHWPEAERAHQAHKTALEAASQ